MIELIGFKNFKALRATTLPLGPFTLLVGPNGSGKSTALQALWAVASRATRAEDYVRFVTADLERGERNPIQVTLHWGRPIQGVQTLALWVPTSNSALRHSKPPHADAPDEAKKLIGRILSGIRCYSLDPRAIATPVGLNPRMELTQDGGCLAGVLDRLRDEQPERFDALNEELARLLPEFDRILFETPNPGQRGFLLRTARGHHPIPAADLSHGTLLAVTMLALAHLPEPPPILALEEPDRGIHPRLLRQVRDALYRLSYPEQFGESRPPVQVIATTQSPYFLDLFKEHPEEIVIAQKEGLEARFERLVDRPDINEILADAPLGEVWYSGVLGGVPG